MDKVIAENKLMGCINNGSTVMIGGFLGVGSPQKLIDFFVDSKVNNLTVITSDTGFEDVGVGKLIVNKQISKVLASHIGTNPETGRQMNSGEIVVDLIPQGTLAERIRAGGAGLGGVLTPTGIGTVVENGKKKLEINGKEYLVEEALRADVALIKAYKGDANGNLVFRRAARNFNPIMAMAADYVIAEVEEYVQNGQIDPDEVMLPGIFVDAIVKGREMDGQ